MTQYMPQYPPSGYYPPPPPPQNGFGVAAFVLGLLGLLFSFIPIIGVIAWPLVLLALVFAGLGLARARDGRATNKGLTIAGLVCALIGLGICILYAAISAQRSRAPRLPPRGRRRPTPRPPRTSPHPRPPPASAPRCRTGRSRSP